MRDHGRKAWRFVAEAAVVRHRPGKRNPGKKKVEVPGPPLPLRLIVTEIRDEAGQVRARRLLRTNVSAARADPATIAKGSDFRWRIEGLHKLLKRSGGQLEEWLQRKGERIMIKLLLALGPALRSGPWSVARTRSRSASGSC